jgi:peptidoglycan-associated lipoprotein
MEIKLDKPRSNREDKRGTQQKPAFFMENWKLQPLQTRQIKLVFRLLIAVSLLGGCAASGQSPANLFNSPPSLSGQPAATPARSPSAMEAISRGVAAVTPPGAALKDVYYEFDSVDLAADAQDILKKNAEWLKAHPTARVEVEGHCDDLGSAEYNLALGAKRAQAAKDFLVSQGIAPERLVTISYGKEAPACFEPTEACRVQNRRARFVMFTELPTS